MDFWRQVPSERVPLPALYVPAAYAFYALTIHVPGKRSRIFITLPLLVLLTGLKPFYTTGNVADDYATTGSLSGLVLMYIDFLIMCPYEGHTVRYTAQLEPAEPDIGTSEDDCTTVWQRTKWSLRFATIARGIGWNVQVKGIPSHPDRDSPRWKVVRRCILRAVLSQVRRLLSVYLIGFAIAIQETGLSTFPPWILDILIGWSGGSWGWNGISALFNIGAAFTIAVGLCEPWEWPPIFGPSSEAYSVRQMWSVVWHQLIRRAVQQPGVRLARFLGMSKGTSGSRYLQLYGAFGISLLMHEWSIFNAVRRDVGELWFFLPQPFVITIEDAMTSWFRSARPAKDPGPDKAALVIGYIWTFAWFSYCLPPFIKGLTGAGIISTGYGEPFAMKLGQQTAMSWLS